HGARHAADRLLAEEDLVARARVRDLEHAQAAVRAAAVMQARDRFLAGIAALREGDVRLAETGLGGEDRLVQLAAPDRRAGLDPERLELVDRGSVPLLFAPALG